MPKPHVSSQVSRPGSRSHKEPVFVERRGPRAKVRHKAQVHVHINGRGRNRPVSDSCLGHSIRAGIRMLLELQGAIYRHAIATRAHQGA